jgi:hypothetical protein
MLTLDTRDFERALLNYEAATGKDLPEVLNRAGKNIAYRAAQFTTPAQPAKIRADILAQEGLLEALTSRRLKKKGIRAENFKAEMKKTLAIRMGSARYLRAAWAEVIAKFGGAFKGKKMRGASALVKKANAVSLLTEITALVNEPTSAKAESAEAKMMPALQEAVNFVAADMLEYAAKKMQDNAKKAGF